MTSGPTYAANADRLSGLHFCPGLLDIGSLFYATATTISDLMGAGEIMIGLLVITSLGCFTSASFHVII